MGMGIGLQPSESTDNLRDHTKKNGSLLQQPTGASPPKALLTLMLVLWTGFIFCRPPQALHSTHSTPAFTTLLPLLLALSLSAPSSMVFPET